MKQVLIVDDQADLRKLLSWSLDEFEEHINQKHCRAGKCDVLVKREQERQQHTPAWLEEAYLPPRIGERYRRQFGAIQGGNGQGQGTAPAQSPGTPVRR